MRLSKVIRATAWGIVAAGVAAPLLRKRVSAPPLATQTVAFAAPLALCLAVRRSRTRDVAVCTLQMWAYLAAYKTPHDDQEAQARRVHIDYPIEIDRVLGLGELPTLRLQRVLARVDAASGAPSWRTLDRVLVWAHWTWFMVPHGSLAVHPRAPARAVSAGRGDDLRRVRHRRERLLARADRAALVRGFGGGQPCGSMKGSEDHGAGDVRRMMVEYGEDFWRDGWGPLYSVLGGNPLAAMPSLHFATSLMAALLLTEAGPFAGALGWSYAATLSFALVYLGEHYVVDLLAGAALTGAVRRLGPSAGPALARLRRAMAALEAVAHEAS